MNWQGILIKKVIIKKKLIEIDKPKGENQMRVKKISIEN